MSQSGVIDLGTALTLTVIQGTTPWIISGNVNASQAGTWNINTLTTLTSITNSVAVTQSTSPWVVSGTVTANAGTGTFLVDGSAHTQPVSGSLGRTWTLNSGTDSVTVTGSVTTSPNVNIHDSAGGTLNSTSNALNVSVQNASLAVTQSTSPWVDNITQFGGTNLSTGTGVGGAGIPRVTVSNDSNVLATQSGTWTTGRTWTLASGTDSVAAVQSGNWSTRTQDGSGNAINSTSNALNVSVQNASIAVTQSTSPWVTKDAADGTPGSAVPGSAIQAGGKDTSGNLQPLLIDENGNLISTKETRAYSAESKVFVATTNNVTVGTAETAFVLFRNPNASGKTVKIFTLGLSGSGTFRLYHIPTVTGNGSSITAQNRKVVSGSQGNVGLMTFSPTASANGSLAQLFTVSSQAPLQFLFDDFLVLPANTSILITAAMGANNTTTNCYMEWAEL